MINLLESFSPQVSKLLCQCTVAESMPTYPKIEVPENFNPKQEFIDKANEAKEKAEEQQKDSIENVDKNNPKALKETQADFNELGTELGKLQTGSAALISRIALIPSAIINVTPMGPGCSPNMVAPMLQSLKAEGDSLSSTYDNCMSKMDKLGLEDVENRVNNNPILSSMTGVVSIVPIVSSVVALIKMVLSVAKVGILAVGSNVAGESGSTPSVSTPNVGYTATAESCRTFSPIIIPEPDENGHVEEIEVSVTNCKMYSALDLNKERSCQNCARYKEK